MRFSGDAKSFSRIGGNGTDGAVGLLRTKGAASPISVSCGPLGDYLSLLGVTRLDYFSLDVEGSELEVIESLRNGETDLPTIDGVNHYQQWIDTIRGEDSTTSNFGYAGPLTETVLLGTLACRFPGEALKWNPKALKFDNHAGASALVKQDYRKGWEVKGLS